MERLRMESNNKDLSFDLDLGEVGYSNRHHFSVSLDATELLPLFEQAREGQRIYELMAIERPGDIWAYVWVSAIHFPPRVATLVDAMRQAAMPLYVDVHPWPEGKVPFQDFDTLFVLMWDDTYPEDEAWRHYRESHAMQRFARSVFERVQGVQRSLEQGDAIMRHEIRRIKDRIHAYDFLDRQAALKVGRSLPIANKPLHPEGFYLKLAELLLDPQLSSVAYRDGCDYRTLRMLCNEQRIRADRLGCQAGQALRLCAIGNFRISNEAWDSELWMYDEGLGYGDLTVEESGDSGAPLLQLHGSPYKTFGRTVLSRKDEGDLAGYEKESGEGWVLYRSRPAPDLDVRFRQPRTEREFQVRKALELLHRSDAIVVAAGSEMGFDSGLPDPRARKEFWNAFPALGRAGIEFRQIASPQAFREMPERAWGFFGYQLALHRKTKPHLGFKILANWSAQNSKELAIFTSGIDGQFQAAGFGEDQLVEGRGSVHWLQCLDDCCPDVWPADEFLPEIDEVEGLLLNAAPRCRHCGGMARPNVLMMDDDEWSQVRHREQIERQSKWLAGVKRPVVFEIGAGTEESGIRDFTERVLRHHGGSLVRINLQDAGVWRELDVSLPMKALEALMAIDSQRMFVHR